MYIFKINFLQILHDWLPLRPHHLAAACRPSGAPRVPGVPGAGCAGHGAGSPRGISGGGCGEGLGKGVGE